MQYYYGSYVKRLLVVADLERAATIAGQLVLAAIYGKGSTSPMTDAVAFQESEARLKAIAARLAERRTVHFRNVPKELRREADAARLELMSIVDNIAVRKKADDNSRASTTTDGTACPISLVREIVRWLIDRN